MTVKSLEKSKISHVQMCLDVSSRLSLLMMYPMQSMPEKSVAKMCSVSPMGL